MPRAGRKRKKRRTEKDVDISEQEKLKTPRCFVLKHGDVGQRIKDLVQDFRMVMMPNCAKKLKESKINRIEDFMAVAGHYGVSHLIIFTATKVGTYMKLAKLPQGPTLTFKLVKFSLAREVRASQKRPRSGPRDYTSAPLQVLNGFGAGQESDASERKLTAEMLRGLFPSIDVPTFNQAECRRVALFNRDGGKDMVQFRHYSVRRSKSNANKGIAALLNPTRLPKLAGKRDVADLVLGGAASDSDEDMEADATDGNKIAVRLTEVGPRLELQLVKCEDGVMNGAVLFHRHLKRTPTEQEVLEQRARQRKKLQQRNDRLDKDAKSHNAALKKKRKDKEKAWSKAENGEGGGGKFEAQGFVDGKGDSDSDDGQGPAKKKRFHPFAFGSKTSKENTVEMDSKPSKSKGGGKTRRSKGGGKRSKGGSKGSGKGGK